MANLRRAAKEDALGIARVYVETWRSTYAGSVPDKVLVGMSAEKQAVGWTRAIERGNEIILVAEEGEAGIVGLGSCGANRQRSSSFAGEVYTLYVHPDHHEQGIGRELLIRLFEELLAAGHNSALIWVLAANPSRFFYEAMGGTRLGERQERLWGVDLREMGYGWPDLGKALQDARPGDSGMR